MRLGTIRTLHKKLGQWMKNQIALDVPESVGLCEYDCRKQQCAEGQWASCERRIQRAAGELWPETKPPQTSPKSSKLTNHRAILVSQLEREEALARLKCAHCQSLFNCDALAETIGDEVQHWRIECRSTDGDNSDVTNPELIEAVRRGIDRFLRDSSGSEDSNESCPPAA